LASSVNSSTAVSDLLPSIPASAFPVTPASVTDVSYVNHTRAKREELSETKIIYGCFIPVLATLSGVFAELILV
jgi:hypothetical protein